MKVRPCEGTVLSLRQDLRLRKVAFKKKKADFAEVNGHER